MNYLHRNGPPVTRRINYGPKAIPRSSHGIYPTGFHPVEIVLIFCYGGHEIDYLGERVGVGLPVSIHAEGVELIVAGICPVDGVCGVVYDQSLHAVEAGEQCFSQSSVHSAHLQRFTSLICPVQPPSAYRKLKFMCPCSEYS